MQIYTLMIYIALSHIYCQKISLGVRSISQFMVSLDSIKKPELLFNVTVHRTLTTEKLCRLFRKFKPYLEFLVKCKISKKYDFIASMYHLHTNLLSSPVYFSSKIYFDFQKHGASCLTFYLILNFFCCDRNLCGIVQGTTDMLLWQAAVMAGTEDGYMNPYTLRSVSQSMMADSHINRAGECCLFQKTTTSCTV